MTYSPGGPGYSGVQQSGAYAPTPQFSKVEDGPSKMPVYLLAGVGILGLAAYLFSFGPIWKSEATTGGALSLGIVAVLFAALFAVIAMLPKQGKYTAVVTATAVVGFLLVVWDLVKLGGDAGWALIAIVVAAALQTIAAIAALLLDAGIISPPAPRPKYAQHQPYGGGYYGQPQFGQPQTGAPQQPPAQGPPRSSQPPGYPQYGARPGAPSTGGFPARGHSAGPPTPPTGFPAYGQPPSQGHGAEPQEGRTQQVSIPQEGKTQQISIPQDSPTQEVSVQREAPTQQVSVHRESPTQQVPAPQPPTEQVPDQQQSSTPSIPPPS